MNISNYDVLERLNYGEYVISLQYEWVGRYHYSNEILHKGVDGIKWFNDWWEGQQDIIIVGYIPVQCVATIPVGKYKGGYDE